MNGQTVYCTAVYLDINLTVRLQKFVQLLEFCDSKRIPLIVGADSNAHSVLWGCEETNKWGEELEELILRFNLNVANSGGECTFSTSRANSIIDITIVNPPTSNSFFPKNWKVLSEESFSNHKYLAFKLGEFEEEIKLTRKLKGVDWQKFTEGMDAAFSSFNESDSLETDVNCFYDLLYEQLDRIAPRRARKPREGSHWWTPELSSMRKELKRLLTHKKNPIMAEELRLVQRSYSSLIRKERSNSCCSFCTKAEAANEVSSLVQIVGNDKERGVSLLRQGDTFAILAEESLDFLLKQHFPLHLPRRKEEQLSEEVGKYMNSDQSEIILQYFQVWRVKAATASFHPMKAARPDDLKPVVLQHIGDEAQAKITNFFKCSRMASFIPKYGVK